MIQEKLITNIVSTMKEIEEELIKIKAHTSKSWTKVVKDKFCELGEKNKYIVSPSEKMPQQWLYDLCWRKFVKQGGVDYLSEVDLILESEWQPRGKVRYDFQKLLQSKAKYKIMIFQKESKEDNNDLLKEMYNSIQSYWNSFDEYYFLMESQKSKTHFHVYPVFANKKCSFDQIEKTRKLTNNTESNELYSIINVTGKTGTLNLDREYTVICENNEIYKYKDVDYLLADGWALDTV